MYGVVISSVMRASTAAISRNDSIESPALPSCQTSHSAALLLLVASKLEEVAPSVDTPHFASPSLQLRELGSTVGRIRAKDDLSALVKEIFAFAATGKERATVVSFTLPSLLRLCSVENKKHLLGLALREPRKTLRKRLCYGVLRSASTKEELLALLTPVRARRLVECGSRKLTEIIAKALVLKALAPLSVPAPMWEARFKENNAKNRGIARTRVSELESVARKGMENLASLDFLSHKPRSKTETRQLIPAGPLHDARMTIGWIVRSAEKLRAGSQPSYGRLRGFLNSATRRLTLESSDAIRVLQSHKLPDKDLWKPSLLRRFTAAFTRIPESERLMTPNLREFVLTNSRNSAERRQCGRVALNYPGELFNMRDARYQGLPSLTRLVLHEIAHSIQMGHEGKTCRWSPSTGEIFSPNNPLIDFQGFCEISGWKALGWFETKAFVGEHAIRVSEKLIPLGRSVTINFPLSKEHSTTPQLHGVVLRRSGNQLYSHNEDAAFSLNTYARSEPCEDWAEAFTEYIMCPDRLIELAPEKFHYMEIHFRAYRAAGDYARLSAVQKSLASLRSHRQPSVQATKDAPTHSDIPRLEQTEFSFMRSGITL